MREFDDIISFMDVMDFDEEIVDARLKSIMERNSFTNQHLMNVTNLLNYKHLLNVKESDECENDFEFEFVGKLIKTVSEGNIDAICKIIDIILSLNPSSIVTKSEHLLQQLLSNISYHLENVTPEETHVTMLISLKLCDSILEAIIRVGEKLSLPFLDVPLENIVLSQNEQLKKHFLTITVKRFFDGITGYNILDQIWNSIQKLDNKLISLKVLCVLSNYYLPLPDNHGDVHFVSNIVTQPEFWEITMYGMLSNDPSTRKLAIYLIKRAMDCMKIGNNTINIATQVVNISWNPGKEAETKKMWDDYFILIDSLEEKQSNIVLPSLQLFDSLQALGQCWLSCAYNIGLQHDNLQVKLQCAKYRLQTPILNDKEALVLLEALNDMNIYDSKRECEMLQLKFKQQIDNVDTFIHIIKNITKVKWSPVPIFHLSTVLGSVNNDKIVDRIGKEQLVLLMYDVLKVQCNNVIIRKAFHRNLSHLIGNCCKALDWKDLLNLYLQLEDDLWRQEMHNPLLDVIKDQLVITDKKQFFNDIMKAHVNIDFILLYLSGHDTDWDIFLKSVCEMFDAIENVNLNTELNDIDSVLKATFLVHLLQKVNNLEINNSQIDSIINKKSEIIFKYIFTLLIEPVEDIDNVLLFLDNIQLIIKLNLNNNCIKEGFGRLRNIFYSKACEVIYVLLQNHSSKNRCDCNEIIKYIDLALECGGYSCIQWILNIIDCILPEILKEENAKFDVSSFLCRTWNEIEALKTNKQYSDCIECFVKIVTNNALLKEPIYNNVIITYCSKIIEYAAMKNIPLYYLVEAMGKRDVLKFGHMVYIFCEVLLATAVPRKDQRIMENLIVELSKTYDLGNVRARLYTNFHIKYESLLLLSKVTDADTLETIATLTIKKIDELFRNKQRYHSNSSLHRTLRIGLQHLLLIFLKHRSNYVENVALWCLEFLGKIPHQPSIRLYLEWYITLYCYYKEEQITELLLDSFKTKNVPITSQFMILYWLLVHKMKRNVCQQCEYDLVMDTYMENTMGPTYSVRLYAQYLAKRIFYLANDKDKIDTSIYKQTIRIIDRTLNEASKLKEKSFDKLMNDFLVHEFDIIEYLLPSAIYNGEFLHEEWNNEMINEVYALNVFNEMIELIRKSSHDKFINEWMETHKSQEEVMKIKAHLKNADIIDNVRDGIGTIQKKYIPWKNMSDIDVPDMKRTESNSELIVVASLIDKLPNLGGMARTSEVFGVQTYVIDSLRHLQDRQFQGLSVSAERWVNVVEVRPGQPLKDYLTSKKAEGYTIVAAEQTSSSIPLQSYKFPRKTLLLLGHEKEGVPCDLLPYMDACVEIPQQGVVRSLNVHVTAAIFVWEYSRQIIL
ncbi:uncharacterized protein LOC119834363 [Zerene cesonia]|uniref:uncharacterized protein LOC119834363 n=1 Tax=Zerene cesonia TaxID=33412 RepID=UPI0018E4F72D|nr:uncharacterized protein LOC119834363 [Zerene cesonia]